MYFTSPVSNITPALASVAMCRSDSRESTTSSIYTSSQGFPSAYESLAMSTSPAWPVTSHPLLRTGSNTSSTHTSASFSSSTSCTSTPSTWLPSPYSSCLNATSEKASSYFSDDELLFSSPPDSLPIESIPNPSPKKELTTEEHIALLREMQEKEDQYAQFRQQQQQRRKTVRFETGSESSRKSSRRSSTPKRRSPMKRGMSQLNGPQ